MLPGVPFTSAPHNILSKPPSAFQKIWIMEVIVSCARGMNPVAVTLEMQFHEPSQQPPVLTS